MGVHVFPILNPPPFSLPVPSLCVVPVHQPQATSILHWTWTGDSFHIWYYTCFNAILPNYPTLSPSHRVQKTVLYICVFLIKAIWNKYFCLRGAINYWHMVWIDGIHDKMFPFMSMTFRKQKLAIHFCMDYELHQIVFLQMVSWYVCCCSSVAQSCLILCDLMDCSKPGIPVLHCLLELLKLMSIELMMPSNHLIFWYI